MIAAHHHHHHHHTRSEVESMNGHITLHSAPKNRESDQKGVVQERTEREKAQAVCDVGVLLQIQRWARKGEAKQSQKKVREANMNQEKEREEPRRDAQWQLELTRLMYSTKSLGSIAYSGGSKSEMSLAAFSV